jgi:transposase
MARSSVKPPSDTPTRKWLRFLKHIDEETPKRLELHWVIDNYATHKHPKVLRWLQKNPRFHLHFTPTGSSWMNRVERFFRDLSEDVVRHGSFESVQELGGAILSYLLERNLNPKAYQWKAKGAEILAKIQRARENWRVYSKGLKGQYTRPILEINFQGRGRQIFPCTFEQDVVGTERCVRLKFIPMPRTPPSTN